jgi:hypothetical protein
MTCWCTPKLGPMHGRMFSKAGFTEVSVHAVEYPAAVAFVAPGCTSESGLSTAQGQDKQAKGWASLVAEGNKQIADTVVPKSQKYQTRVRGEIGTRPTGRSSNQGCIGRPERLTMNGSIPAPTDCTE